MKPIHREVHEHEEILKLWSTRYNLSLCDVKEVYVKLKSLDETYVWVLGTQKYETKIEEDATYVYNRHITITIKGDKSRRELIAQRIKNMLNNER